MNKEKVLNIFGSVTKTAKALGVTRSAVSQWSDDLPQMHVDRVVGAAVRLKVVVPPDILNSVDSTKKIGSL